MSLSLGGIILPASILAAVLRLKGPVQLFIKAGAVSPDTARRPSSVGVQSEYLLEPLAKRGLLIKMGDGRFYADVKRVRRRNAVLYSCCGLMAAVGLGFLLFGWLRG